MDQPQSDIKFFSLNVTRGRCLKLGESVTMSSDSRRAQHRLLTRLMERSRLKTKQLLAQQPPTPNSRRRSLTSARGSNAAGDELNSRHPTVVRINHGPPLAIQREVDHTLTIRMSSRRVAIGRSALWGRTNALNPAFRIRAIRPKITPSSS